MPQLQVRQFVGNDKLKLRVDLSQAKDASTHVDVIADMGKRVDRRRIQHVKLGNAACLAPPSKSGRARRSRRFTFDGSSASASPAAMALYEFLADSRRAFGHEPAQAWADADRGPVSLLRRPDARFLSRCFAHRSDARAAGGSGECGRSIARRDDGSGGALSGSFGWDAVGGDRFNRIAVDSRIGRLGRGHATLLQLMPIRVALAPYQPRDRGEIEHGQGDAEYRLVNAFDRQSSA